MKAVLTFFRDDRGTEAVEWALVLGILLLGAVTAASAIGNFVHESFMGVVTP